MHPELAVSTGKRSDTVTGSRRDFEVMIRDCFQSPDDIDALIRFDAAFRPYLLAILRSYRPNLGLAEDVYQSVLIKLITLCRNGQRPRVHYRGYLVAIAKHCLIDEVRRQRRYVPISEICVEKITHISADEMKTDARLLVHQGIKQLDRRSQFILKSYYLEQMPVATLAKLLGIRPCSVHMAIKRCRTQLGKILSTDVRNCRAETSSHKGL